MPTDQENKAAAADKATADAKSKHDADAKQKQADDDAKAPLFGSPKKKELSAEEVRLTGIAAEANDHIKHIRLAAAKARLENLTFTDAKCKFEEQNKSAETARHDALQKKHGDFYARAKRFLK